MSIALLLIVILVLLIAFSGFMGIGNRWSYGQSPFYILFVLLVLVLVLKLLGVI